MLLDPEPRVKDHIIINKALSRIILQFQSQDLTYYHKQGVFVTGCCHFLLTQPHMYYNLQKSENVKQVMASQLTKQLHQIVQQLVVSVERV